jgi:hypothetical protein
VGYKKWIELAPSEHTSFMTSPGQYAAMSIYGDNSAKFWMG